MNCPTLEKLEFERGIEDIGASIDRDVPVIDMHDFDTRRDEIADQIWDAATNIGFFQLNNLGVPDALINRAFDNSKRFFALSNSEKQACPLKNNAGWESKSLERPSTRTQDQKESYRITLPRMQILFPTESQLPEFEAECREFERRNWKLAQKALNLFAEKLGMTATYMAESHDREKSIYQSTLRLLHYYALDKSELNSNLWRAGGHTDFTTISLLHQRNGQGGLEVCSGIDAKTSLSWSSVKPENYVITCNIGDMLMRWSDDKLKSTLHRVLFPQEGEDLSARYSVVYFCQANEDVELRGPEGKVSHDNCP